MDRQDELTAYRRVFEVLYRAQPAEALEASWSRFLAPEWDYMEEPPEELIPHFIHNWDDNKHGYVPEDDHLVISLDASVSDKDLVFAVNNVLAYNGFDPSFSWTFHNPRGAAPHEGLYELDQWLRPQGHTLLNFNTSADFHLAAIVPVEQLAELIEVGDQIRDTEGRSNSAVLFPTPDGWKDGPPSANLDAHPHDPGESVDQMKVRDGAPETWWVIVREIRKSFGRTAVRFVSDDGPPQKSTRNLNDATAFRKHPSVPRMTKEERQIKMTLEQARTYY